MFFLRTPVQLQIPHMLKLSLTLLLWYMPGRRELTVILINESWQLDFGFYDGVTLTFRTESSRCHLQSLICRSSLIADLSSRPWLCTSFDHCPAFPLHIWGEPLLLARLYQGVQDLVCGALGMLFLTSVRNLNNFSSFFPSPADQSGCWF